MDIEDDVLRAAKELAEREGRTVGQTISELARRGLLTPLRERKRRAVTRGGVPVLPSRGKVITLDHVKRLRDEEGI